MAREDQTDENRLPEPVERFIQPVEQFFKNYQAAQVVWKDRAFDELNELHVGPLREMIKEYLTTLNHTVTVMEAIHEESGKLLSPTAGLGGWLSIFDMEMIVRRTTSRWFCGDGWGS
jgi:hypothetical protein